MSTLLRLCTAGSVDDGKSTLIGRLLYEARAVRGPAVVGEGRVPESRRGPIDFSLFTDGLKAEREQGITIDVAYRHFATARRKFILADTPGHEQYTRNMATGASTADLAILLVDARTACANRRGATPGSPGCSASRTSCSPSTRWIWSASIARLRDIHDSFSDPRRAPSCTPFRSAP